MVVEDGARSHLEVWSRSADRRHRRRPDHAEMHGRTGAARQDDGATDASVELLERRRAEDDLVRLLEALAGQQRRLHGGAGRLSDDGNTLSIEGERVEVRTRPGPRRARHGEEPVGCCLRDVA